MGVKIKIKVQAGQTGRMGGTWPCDLRTDDMALCTAKSGVVHVV